VSPPAASHSFQPKLTTWCYALGTGNVPVIQADADNGQATCQSFVAHFAGFVLGPTAAGSAASLAANDGETVACNADSSALSPWDVTVWTDQSVATAATFCHVLRTEATACS
jgi:hypothetical protein